MNTDQNINRPKLKKIKRPINRAMPVGVQPVQPSTQQQNPQQQNPQQFQPQQNMAETPRYQPQVNNITTADVNQYLDGPLNLPDRFSQQQNQQPAYIGDEEYYDDQAVYSDTPAWLNSKVFVIVAVTCLFVGLLIGKFVFPQSTVVRNGLQGVVINSEVPRGRARCGVAERSQGCVLYVMNPQKREMTAKDFYDIASQMTGRQRFMIETGNMRYANTLIKPGDIAQLNIPPL